MMSSAWVDGWTLWGRPAFIRAAGMHQTALTKSTSSQVASCSYGPRRTRKDPESFPLDRAGRLGRHVVDDPIDAADLVDDPGGRLAEHVPGELEEVGGHAVGRGDRAQGQD